MRQRLLGFTPSYGKVIPAQLALFRHELGPKNDSFFDNDLDGVGPPAETHGEARGETPVGRGLHTSGGSSHAPQRLKLGKGGDPRTDAPTSLGGTLRW